MVSFKVITAIGLVLMFSVAIRAIERPTTIGRMFFFSIPSDYVYKTKPSKRIYVSSQTDKAVSVQVRALEGAVSRQITIPARQEAVVDLPRPITSRGTGLKENTIGILADGDISVHVQMEAGVNSGAFTPLPTTSLGTDYVVGIYEPLLPRYRSGFVVTAANEALLRIMFTQEVEYDGVSYGPRREFTLNLEAHQSFQVMSDKDLSGTRIKSSMPVAVVAGSECSRVPRGVKYCDYLVEQLPPVHSLGKQFLVTPFKDRDQQSISYLVKFVASFNDTEIEFLTGNLRSVRLQAGEHREILVSSRHEQVSFRSSQPVLVLQFMKGFRGGDWVGDPSMVVVPPVEQFISGPLTFSSMLEDHVTVAVTNTNTTASAGLRVNGKKISRDWDVTYDDTIAVLHGTMRSGSYTLSHMDPRAKFMIIGYGIGYLSSRSYPVAYGLRRLYVPSEQPLFLPPTGYKVECFNTSMSVTLDPSVFLIHQPSDVTLNDDTCTAPADSHDTNDGLIVLRTSFDSCGTQVQEYENTVTFSNSLWFAESVVTPVSPQRDLPFKCVIEQQVGLIGASSLNSYDDFDASRVVLSDSVLGNLTLSLTQYMDETLIHDATGNASTDAWADILEGTQGHSFFAVNVTSSVDSGVFVDSCWTSPHPNPEDPYGRGVVQDGCGVDDTIRIGASIDDPRFRPIAADIFSPDAEYREVYMHCRVQVCRGPDSAADCAQECGESRKRRDVNNPREVYTLSTGPVKATRNEHKTVLI